MNKKEYLDKLAKELGAMSFSDVSEILDDIGSHFDEASAAGEDEEKTAAGLGDPKDLASQFKEGTDLNSILTSKRKDKAKKEEPTSQTVMFCVLITIFVAIPSWMALFCIVLCLLAAEIAAAAGAVALLCTFVRFGSFLVSGLFAGLTLLFLSVFGYALNYFAIKYFISGTKWYIAAIRKVWHNGI